MSIVVRYPGRACLLGEHCDWAGGASLTVPLPMGIELHAEAGSDGVDLRTDMDGELLEGTWATRDPAPGPVHALRFVPAVIDELVARGHPVAPTRLWGQASLPTGRGFSSSAAFCLALADALARRAGRVLDRRELVEIAYAAEHDRVGVACGRLDQIACAAGAPVFIQWGLAGGTPAIRPVVPRGVFHLVVAAFSAPRNTPGILEVLNRHFVADLRDRDLAEGARAVRVGIDAFAKAAERGARALETGDAWALGAAMDDAQRVYEEEWEVSLPLLRAPQLRRATQALRLRGALGAKFSGAGGDGSAVALFADAADADAARGWLEGEGTAAWYVPLRAT